MNQITSRPRYPRGVPSKFDPDGNVQPFPGNTVVSHLAPSSDLYISMLGLYDKLSKSHLSHLYTMLPPSSWHMTIFEGVCDQVRKPGFWPTDLSFDATMEECTTLFEEKLSSFSLQCDPPYLAKITGFSPLEIGIGVHVELRTDEEEMRLRELRDRLSDLLQIRHPQHSSYELHLSMAYLLRHLSEDQERELKELLMDHFKEMPLEFELGAPEFCTFDDMFAFRRVFFLEDRR